MCGDRIAGLSQKRAGHLIEERTRRRIEWIEQFALTQTVKLISALLHGLCQRGPYAASFVAQQAQQPDRRRTQRERGIEVRRHVGGGETHREPDDQHDPRPDGLPRTDVQIHL